MTAVDWKALAAQEPEFVAFCKDILWETSVQHDEYIKALYSFYQCGFTVQQIVDWAKTTQKLGTS
jgi:hypothetical protein